MFERAERSYRLLRESSAVLMSDPSLILFPICSAIASLVVGATFLLPLFLAGTLDGLFDMSRGGHPGHLTNAPGLFFYGALFLAYAANYFVVIFFNVGLISCARGALRGEHPTFKDGLSAAVGRVGTIASWAIFAATVGVVLKIIQDRSGLIGRIVTGFLGVVWTIGTALVVPVIAFEDVSPIDAVKRSASLIKKTWGESLVAGIGFSLLTLGALLVSVVLIAVGLSMSLTAGVVCFGVAVLLFMLTITVESALRGIFQVALYSYASDGVVPSGISEDFVSAAYRRK